MARCDRLQALSASYAHVEAAILSRQRILTEQSPSMLHAVHVQCDADVCERWGARALIEPARCVSYVLYMCISRRSKMTDARTATHMPARRPRKTPFRGSFAPGGSPTSSRSTFSHCLGARVMNTALAPSHRSCWWLAQHHHRPCCRCHIAHWHRFPRAHGRHGRKKNPKKAQPHDNHLNERKVELQVYN